MSGFKEKSWNPQLAYWKRQLGTGLTTLNLPTDYERPVVQTYRGARLTRTLSEELTKALKDLSRREGVTLFMTLLATPRYLVVPSYWTRRHHRRLNHRGSQPSRD